MPQRKGRRYLQYHTCGHGIYVRGDLTFYDAERPRPPGGPAERPPITVCPRCGQLLRVSDLDYSESQLGGLAGLLGRILADDPDRGAEDDNPPT